MADKSVIKMRCVSDYSNAKDTFKKGDVIEVSREYARWLINDSPGSFVSVTEEKTAPAGSAIMDKPPVDRMVTGPGKGGSEVKK